VAAGSNFAEAAAAGKLQVVNTPPMTGAGIDRANAGFRFPAQYAPALRTGFEMEPNDEPVVEPLADEGGYVMVAPDRVVPASPAPLASIRAQVAADWTTRQASQRAQAAGTAIAAKAARGMSLADAVRQAGVTLPAVQQVAGRRLDLSQMGNQVPAPLRMLFVLGQGKSRMVADPEGRGFSVVKTTRIVPGNALTQPALIGRVQSDFQGALSEEYARQFLAAIRASVGVERNEAAIAASRKRIIGS
jgi:peptidyl-prolyl cis-trans isomerase D